MRLPSLPIYVDEFPALRSREYHRTPIVHLFALSHFHTDHMKGLHARWSTGIILTSTITKQLLLSKYENLRSRVFGLPYWCRTPLLAATAPETRTPSAGEEETNLTEGPSPSSVVYLTLLPAFHIPGSAMLYFETPSGVTYLYTGDFKYTREAAEMSPLRSFLHAHRVDHLYLDDTWLHLGHVEVTRWSPRRHESSTTREHAIVTVSEEEDGSDDGSSDGEDARKGLGESGLRVLSKLLDERQVAEAIEAIGRRMDHQRQLFKASQRGHFEEQSVNSTEKNYAVHNASAEHNVCSGTAVDDGAKKGRTPSVQSAVFLTRQPFIVRVYLHNQFGKELLIQQLAERLQTRAMIDDARFARLLAVVEALDEERDDLQAFREATKGFANTQAVPSQQHETASEFTSIFTAKAEVPLFPPPLSPEEEAWRAAGGEAARYPYNLNCFMSTSQAATLQLPHTSSAATEAGTAHHESRVPLQSAAIDVPLIEVVSSRAEISPEALQRASAARGGTPHYGVIISGWARLQSHDKNNKHTSVSTTSSPSASSTLRTDGQVWHIPTTLHNTPQELINFVSLLRPLSITPLHYRPSRAAMVMQRLGPFLRTPFVNRQDGDGEAGVNACAHEENSREGGVQSIFAAPSWQLWLPGHVISQNCVDAAQDGSATVGTKMDGLDALADAPRTGYRIRPPSVTGVLEDLTENVLSTTPKHVAVKGVSLFGEVADGSVSRKPHCDFKVLTVGTATAAANCGRNFTQTLLNVQELMRKRGRPESNENRRLSSTSSHPSCNNNKPSLSEIADRLF